MTDSPESSCDLPKEDLPPPVYCIFDSSATEEVSKLSDYHILSMIILHDYSTHHLGCLARMFELDLMELYAFVHPFTSHEDLECRSSAEGWVDALYITEDDGQLMTDAVNACRSKADVCHNNHVSYIDHTDRLTDLLEVAMENSSIEGVPGVANLHELEKSWEFYTRGDMAIDDLLSRAWEE